MMVIEKLVRIIFIARKAKKTGLTEAEKKEQNQLREEYLAIFRENFRRQLENIEIVD